METDHKQVLLNLLTQTKPIECTAVFISHYSMLSNEAHQMKCTTLPSHRLDSRLDTLLLCVASYILGHVSVAEHKAQNPVLHEHNDGRCWRRIQNIVMPYVTHIDDSNATRLESYVFLGVDIY